jgi:hypothetical protein
VEAGISRLECHRHVKIERLGRYPEVSIEQIVVSQPTLPFCDKPMTATRKPHVEMAQGQCQPADESRFLPVMVATVSSGSRAVRWGRGQAVKGAAATPSAAPGGCDRRLRPTVVRGPPTGSWMLEGRGAVPEQRRP